MSIFFIKLQKKSLNNRLYDVKKNYQNVHTLGNNLNHSYSMYVSKTKTWEGWAKSFLPFTYEYKVRSICADRLKKVNHSINQLKKQPKPSFHKKSPFKSHSDSDLYVKSSYKKIAINSTYSPK